MQVSQRTTPLGTTPLGNQPVRGASPTTPLTPPASQPGASAGLAGDRAEIAQRPSEATSLQDLVAKAQAAMQAQQNQAPAAAPNLAPAGPGAVRSQAVSNAIQASRELFVVEATGEGGKDTFMANRNTISVIEGKAFDANSGSKNWLREIKENYRLSDESAASLAAEIDQVQALAQEQVTANASLEQEELEKLPAEQQQQFKKIAETTDFDPSARLALQMMLLEGKASPALLGTLSDLASKPLANGLEAGELVADLIQEIHVPGSISQHDKGTCTVTSIQVYMAQEMPEEYARVVAGLASPEGQVTLADGTTITREPGTELPDDTPRTASSRLWQTAMMELGNGDHDYDNTKDVHIAPDGKDNGSGLAANQTARVLQAVTGQAIETKDLSLGALMKQIVAQSSPEEITRLNAMTREDYLSHMQERVNQMRPQLAEETVITQLAAGQPLVVGLDWGERDATGRVHGGHELLATKTSRDESGQVWIHLNNPWGQAEKLPKEEFFKRINEYHVPVR